MPYVAIVENNGNNNIYVYFFATSAVDNCCDFCLFFSLLRKTLIYFALTVIFITILYFREQICCGVIYRGLAGEIMIDRSAIQ